MKLSIKQRLEKASYPEPNTGCWLWGGADINGGYGQIQIKDKKQLSHRVSYELHKGKIPEGLVLDHLCRQPSCINPDHLEPVTQLENMRRGKIGMRMIGFSLSTHCMRGHEFNEKNTYRHKRGRHCRTCKSQYNKYYYLKRKSTLV